MKNFIDFLTPLGIPSNRIILGGHRQGGSVGHNRLFFLVH